MYLAVPVRTANDVGVGACPPAWCSGYLPGSGQRMTRQMQGKLEAQDGAKTRKATIQYIQQIHDGRIAHGGLGVREAMALAAFPAHSPAAAGAGHDGHRGRGPLHASPHPASHYSMLSPTLHLALRFSSIQHPKHAESTAPAISMPHNCVWGLKKLWPLCSKISAFRQPPVAGFRRRLEGLHH